MKPQTAALDRGVHIVVGTPGRLLDHVDRGSFEAFSIKTLVLDEADRMLDMGFGADVESIMEHLPSGRQTALFSATFPDAIESMCRRLQNPLRVTITSDDTHTGIEHWKLVVSEEQRLGALFWVLANYPHDSVVVFCNFKATVANLLRELNLAGVSAERLDGDLEQFHRDQVLARFRNQSIKVLVATDVAGRGLDVEGLELVVNYELPSKADAYVHRAGRTGRAGKTGNAISLVSPRQSAKLGPIESVVGTLRTVDWPESANIDELLSAIKGMAPMETLLVSGGRKDKVRPGDILGALTGDAGGLEGTEIGKIEIRDRLSYVAVSRKVSERALRALNAGRIKGKRFRVSLVGPVSSSQVPRNAAYSSKKKKRY